MSDRCGMSNNVKLNFKSFIYWQVKKIIMHTDHSTDAVQSDMHRTEEHVNRLINHCSECACIYMGMFLDMK